MAAIQWAAAKDSQRHLGHKPPARHNPGGLRLGGSIDVAPSGLIGSFTSDFSGSRMRASVCHASSHGPPPISTAAARKTSIGTLLDRIQYVYEPFAPLVSLQAADLIVNPKTSRWGSGRSVMRSPAMRSTVQGHM